MCIQSAHSCPGDRGVFRRQVGLMIAVYPSCANINEFSGGAVITLVEPSALTVFMIIHSIHCIVVVDISEVAVYLDSVLGARLAIGDKHLDDIVSR